ncbi:MAG TPA: hypothetical protein VK363_07055 [Pyrinomonadaceae bacterium]|nr:hypothetical protein [Pyrinomonadaceae bacterium]
MKSKYFTKNKYLVFSGTLVVALLLSSAAGVSRVIAAAASPVRVASNEAEARSTVERAFQQLKSGDYNSLYDVLPSASQRRISRERFVSALERTRGMYELERLEIGAVRVVGDLGVADSVVYGRGRAPFAGEAKIVSRQYLVREGGRWRVTTGDRTTIQPLLAANPAFAKKYPLTQPRLYLKRDNRWVDMTKELGGIRRRATR